MSNPVVWFEIYVQDMARAKAFYEAVFGLPLTRLDHTEHEIWAFPMGNEGYGASGALIHVPGKASGGNGMQVYFQCNDCAVEAAKAVRAGGCLHKEKCAIAPYGHIAMIIDTEGNTVGLHSMR